MCIYDLRLAVQLHGAYSAHLQLSLLAAERTVFSGLCGDVMGIHIVQLALRVDGTCRRERTKERDRLRDRERERDRESNWERQRDRERRDRDRDADRRGRVRPSKQHGYVFTH